MEGEGFLMVVIGLLVALMGYLIKYRGWLFLIAGYGKRAEEEVGDKKTLARHVGGFTLAAGLFTAAMPFLVGFLGEGVWWIFTLLIVGGAVGLLIRALGRGY